MMSFITEEFLLNSETARRLYHEYAEKLPIIDYHCHLSPKDIAENRQFKDLYEIWLEGDHYKWRAMRANGIEEERVTGNAEPEAKFEAFAQTVPECLRNPLYHWSHLELKRYFGIEKTVNSQTSSEIWKETKEALKKPEFSAHGILERFKVSVMCTTDDPTDSLEYHQAIARSGIGTKVYPTFRPDKAIATQNPEQWNGWTDKLEKVSGGDCGKLEGFLDALKARHDFFGENGCRLSDHGLERCFADFPSEVEADEIYKKLRSNHRVSEEEQERFASFMMEYFGALDAEKGWTKQLHLGAMRNVNDRLYAKLGSDVGGDSIGDFRQGKPLAGYLGRLAGNEQLPKTILYNLNPTDNYLFATMIGNFQEGGISGKMQFGSGWWFLDQKEGMTWQINALSNLGLLGKFVGMLTDSRSFMSYCRHEYFRRLLCDIIGTDVENGELPVDDELLGNLVYKVCYGNAANYFGFELGKYQA